MPPTAVVAVTTTASERERRRTGYLQETGRAAALFSDAVRRIVRESNRWVRGEVGPDRGVDGAPSRRVADTPEAGPRGAGTGLGSRGAGQPICVLWFAGGGLTGEFAAM